MLMRCVSSCCMSSGNRLDRNVFGHVHVCRTPDAERVQPLCKWCATCASGLLHCATARCTLYSHISFRSGCAWATMDPQLQQLQQLLQLLQAGWSGSGSGASSGAPSRPVQASGSGSQGSRSQASTSSRLTTPKRPQIDEQASSSPTELTTLPPLQSHFPCKSELLVQHSCQMDAPLADDSLEWRWLRDVTPKYLYRRALCHWLKKCRQVDPSGIIIYPWQGSALTATRWSDWKILRIGLQGYAEACMVLSEAALYPLFMVWQRAGLGEAIAAKWVSGGTPEACVGGHRHGHGPQFFFHDVGGISEEVYDVHNDGAYGASPRSLLEAGATISGGYRRTTKAVDAVAHSNAPSTTSSPPNVMPPTYTPIEKVCNRCARVCKCCRAHTQCVNDCRMGG